VHLEEMIVRDRMHAQDAVALLAHHPRWGLSSDAARELHGRLNCRAPRRRPVGLAAVEATHMTPPAIDAIDLHELQVRTHVVRHALASAIRRLSIDERQLLKMRFQDGHSISDIAVLLNLDAKPLYRRFNRILRRLRSELERRRLTLSVVRELVGQNGAEFASDFPGESAA
jgi:RNA polymerase sigma factor (sigma-70 family)